MKKETDIATTARQNDKAVANCDNMLDERFLQDIVQMIDKSRSAVAIHVNAEVNKLYRSIGKYIVDELMHEPNGNYGKGILAALSQELMSRYGKGFNYTALTRMVKVARIYDDDEIFATLSQELSWSHIIELVTIEDPIKRLFYQQMAIANHWSTRQLHKMEDAMLYERTAIAAKPEEQIISTLQTISPEHYDPNIVFRSSYVLDFLELHDPYSEKDLEDAILRQLEQFIMELGQGFAFLERQKRITVDGTDYYIDLLFYHRKLKCLVAIDLKLGKFKPEYKGQMDLYLRYLQRHETQADENPPIGLLLCSEGNTEHIELMMLDEDNVRVAQYLTELPNRQWFIDKLNRSILIAKENKTDK